MSCLAAVTRASSTRPMICGAISAVMMAMITSTTMISIRVKPDSRREISMLRLSMVARMISERLPCRPGLAPSVTARSTYNPTIRDAGGSLEAGDDVSGPGLAIRGHARFAGGHRARRRRNLRRSLGRARLRPLGPVPGRSGGTPVGDGADPAGDAGGRDRRVARVDPAWRFGTRHAGRPQPWRVQRPGRGWRARLQGCNRARALSGRGDAARGP